MIASHVKVDPPMFAIGYMIKRDLDQVVAIEKETSEYPTSRDDFLQALRKRNVIGMTVRSNGRVVGYMVYELFPSGVNVMKFVVPADRRREGIGRAMIAQLAGKLSPRRRTKITMMVRESAYGGHCFLKAMGFTAVKVMRDLYADSGEDGYLFVYSVDTEEVVRCTGI